MNSRKIRTHGAEFAILYRLCDLAVIGSSLAAASYLHLGSVVHDWLVIGTLISVCYLLFAESAHLYRSWRVSNFQGQMMATLLPWFGACALLVAFFFFSKTGEEFSRIVMFLWFVIGGTGLILWRYIARSASVNYATMDLIRVEPQSLAPQRMALSLRKNLSVTMHWVLSCRDFMKTDVLTALKAPPIAHARQS